MPQHYLKKSNTPENLYAIELQRKAIPYYSRRTIYEKKISTEDFHIIKIPKKEDATAKAPGESNA